MEHFDYGVKSIFPSAQNIVANKDEQTISFDLIQRAAPHSIEISETIQEYMKMCFGSTSLSLSIRENRFYVNSNNRYGMFISVVISDVIFLDPGDRPLDENKPTTGFGLADLARFKERHPQNTQ